MLYEAGALRIVKTLRSERLRDGEVGPRGFPACAVLEEAVVRPFERRHPMLDVAGVTRGEPRQAIGEQVRPDETAVIGYRANL